MKVEIVIMNSVDNIYRKAENLYNDSKYLLIKQGSSTLMNAMKALGRTYPYNINEDKHLSGAIKSLVKLNILLDNGWKPDDNYITDKLSFVDHKIDKERCEHGANPMSYILDMDSTNDYNYLAYCLAYYYSKDNIANITIDDYNELSGPLNDYYYKFVYEPDEDENPFYGMSIIDDLIKSFIIMNSMKVLLNNADSDMPEEFIIELVKSNSDLLADLSEESIVEFIKSKLY